MTETEKVIAEGFQIAANDLESHKLAIQRLVENQEAQHRKLVEMAEILNSQSQYISELVSQVAALSGKPPAPAAETVN
jgi:hypothetical protein